MQGFWNLIGKAGQGPGKDFQYDVGERLSSSFDSKSVWNLHHGKKRSTGEIVSVFVCDAKVASPDDFHLAKTAYKRLRTLRHPNIISFLDGFESENLVYVVTEPVIPLATFLDVEDGRNSNLIAWGLHQITTGLSFLVNVCDLIHENINIFSIFVGLDGEWELGGVEYVHTFGTDPVAKLPFLSRYDTPEAKSCNKIEKWSTDAWGLGCLIWEIYNGALQKSSDLKILNKIPKLLVLHYCNLVSAKPNSRTNPKSFLEKCKAPGQFLNNDFIKANLFLQEIQIKDVAEQKRFFISLDKSLDSFPKQFCVHRVLPQLLNAFEFGSAGSAVLSPLFKVGLLLDDDAYQAKILPCIIKLFSSNDRSTRIQLLQQMEKFVKHLQPTVVDGQIFTCVATGFGDTLPAMREQTVKAMLLLAPKLSGKTINNHLLRYFAKLQMDEQPGIRTNTTVCLGKIAEHLPPATRQKVLVPAFTRALRDPFPPARCAGIMSIAATQEYYSMNEVATKLLPGLCVLTIDPEKGVRDNAFRVVKSMMQKLEKYSNSPESPLNNKEAAEREVAGHGSTWTGWAVTSLTSRFYQNQANTKQKASPNDDDSPSKQNDVAAKPKAEVDNVTNCEQSKEDVQSDHSDYGDAWEDDEWEDAKDDFVSVKEDILSVREEVSKFPEQPSKDVGKNIETGNDSDSDYGDWGGDDWSFETKTVKKEPKQKTVTKGTKSQQKEKSVADLLGIDTNDDDFLKASSRWDDNWNDSSNRNEQSFAEKPFVSKKTKASGNKSVIDESSNDWGGNDNNWGAVGSTDDQGEGWNDNTWGDLDQSDFKSEEEERKEKKKLELQKKRGERRLQRELLNKAKRTKSVGAMKLGAVTKTPK